MTTLLNTVPIANARKQIGEQGWEDIENLCLYLGLPKNAFEIVEPRYASSPIVRSEAEFLNLSSPRFAIRFYLDGSRQTFINCRRLQLMLDSLGADSDEIGH